jgi:replication-associated recombination protein RarA
MRTIMPPATINPYIAGDPVGETHAFIGRTDILNELFNMLNHPKHNAIVLYGQRRIGKTSVLQYLQAELIAKGNYCPIYFDLQDKATWPLEKVVKYLARAIARALNQDEPDLGTNPKLTFQETWLPQVVQNLPNNIVI